MSQLARASVFAKTVSGAPLSGYALGRHNFDFCSWRDGAGFVIDHEYRHGQVDSHRSTYRARGARGNLFQPPDRLRVTEINPLTDGPTALQCHRGLNIGLIATNTVFRSGGAGPGQDACSDDVTIAAKTSIGPIAEMNWTASIHSPYRSRSEVRSGPLVPTLLTVHEQYSV